MNAKPAEMPDDKPDVVEQIQHSGLVAALTAVLVELKRRLPESDTSIDWEDGEVGDDGEAKP